MCIMQMTHMYKHTLTHIRAHAQAYTHTCICACAHILTHYSLTYYDQTKFGPCDSNTDPVWVGHKPKVLPDPTNISLFTILCHLPRPHSRQQHNPILTPCNIEDKDLFIIHGYNAVLVSKYSGVRVYRFHKDMTFECF